MRRAYGAVCVMLTLFLLVAISRRYVLYVTAKMISGLDYGTQLYQVGEYGAGEQLLDNLYSYYQTHEPFLALLVRKEYLNEIDCNLRGLPAFFNVDSPSDYSYSVLCLKEKILALQKLFLGVL